MSKLDELRKLVADTFKEVANDKTTIEKAAVINSKLDELAEEEKALLDKNTELLGAYREAVLHTSVKPTNNNVPDAGVPQKQAPTFEEFLSKWNNK